MLSASAKGALTLTVGDVVMRVACFAVKCASRYAYGGGECVKFLDGVAHEMEPRITVLLYVGVVYVHHLFLSLP